MQCNKVLCYKYDVSIKLLKSKSFLTICLKLVKNIYLITNMYSYLSIHIYECS